MLDKSASRSIHKFNENSGLTGLDELASFCFILVCHVQSPKPAREQETGDISVDASDNVAAVAF